MAQAICGPILANHISEFSVDEDQLPIYGVARVTAYRLCKVILSKACRIAEILVDF